MSTDIYHGVDGISISRCAQYCEICGQRGRCVGFFGWAESKLILCVPHFAALVKAILEGREFKP